MRGKSVSPLLRTCLWLLMWLRVKAKVLTMPFMIQTRYFSGFISVCLCLSLSHTHTYTHTHNFCNTGSLPIPWICQYFSISRLLHWLSPLPKTHPQTPLVTSYPLLGLCSLSPCQCWNEQEASQSLTFVIHTQWGVGFGWKRNERTASCWVRNKTWIRQEVSLLGGWPLLLCWSRWGAGFLLSLQRVLGWEDTIEGLLLSILGSNS